MPPLLVELKQDGSGLAFIKQEELTIQSPRYYATVIFLMKAHNKLLKHSHAVLRSLVPSDSPCATHAEADSVDVYYRFGGATLASMEKDHYKAMKLEQTKDKGKLSQEIHILQALNTKDKEKVPVYLKYRDLGFMYFPCQELIPFLQDVDVAVKAVCNETGFKK